MTAFQRLSATPAVPDLLRRDADRRAVRHCRAVPAAAWCRPATIAVAWNRRLNGRLFEAGLAKAPGEQAAPSRLTADLAPLSTVVRGSAAQRPMQARSNAIARSRRAALQADLSAHTVRSWECQAGMKLCFAGASGILAATRLLTWCGLLSRDGIAAALTGADRLTRAGMRLWRGCRMSRRT